jgi:hypothetical protein
MSKTLTILAASTALALFSLSPVFAESIEEMEKPLDNSNLPKAEPGSERGTDKPIADQERMQLGNFPDPNVPEGKGANKKGDESIPKMEQDDFAD